MSEPQTPPPPTPPGQPEQQKKGLGPVAWILIGCGGVLLIGVLLVGACGMFVAKKVGDAAGDFAENPGRSAAELMVKLNPDLELVGTDDDAETITIRNTETGEVFTADWSDIESGNFKLETDEGTFDVDTSAAGDGDGAVISMKSDDGTTTQIFGGGSADNIPGWTPIPDGAGERQSIYSTSDGTTSNGVFNFHTTDSVAEVLDFYESALSDLGFEVSKSTFSSGGRDGGMVGGEDKAGGRSMSASVGTDQDGKTLVSVTYSSGG